MQSSSVKNHVLKKGDKFLTHNSVELISLNENESIFCNFTRSQSVYIQGKSFDTVDLSYEIVEKGKFYNSLYPHSNFLKTSKSNIFYFKINKNLLQEKGSFKISYQTGLNNLYAINKFVESEREFFKLYCVYNLIKNNFLYIPTQTDDVLDSNFHIVKENDLLFKELDRSVDYGISSEMNKINNSSYKNLALDDIKKYIYTRDGHRDSIIKDFIPDDFI